jgi:broad specificity phosphatase PhoE
VDILFVRHGESENNANGRLQGRNDSPLTDRGRTQAATLAAWLLERGFRWSTAYASPLSRARETAEILAEKTGFPRPVVDEDLAEVSVGSLEALTRDEIGERYPTFMSRAIADLGDFSEFGGESYDSVQARTLRVLTRLQKTHREAADQVLVVAHGGMNFQMVKAAICLPVPRVCILQWGNCTASLLRFRERRGVYMADIAWHVPLELMGGAPAPGATAVFR